MLPGLNVAAALDRLGGAVALSWKGSRETKKKKRKKKKVFKIESGLSVTKELQRDGIKIRKYYNTIGELFQEATPPPDGCIWNSKKVNWLATSY